MLQLRTFRSLAIMLGLASILLFASGCSSMPKLPKVSNPLSGSPHVERKWFLDPSVEFGNYKTYGFLQVTAVRYTDPIEKEKKSKRSLLEKATFRNEYKDAPLVVHHTDELIWRTLQAEMAHKGYHQVAPQEADLWVIYYGGPRPVRPMSQLRIKPHPFDQYFAENEITEDIFFVDVIDAQKGELLFRGWDSGTFHLSKDDIKHQRGTDAQKVIDTAEEVISFFPTKVQY